MVSEAVDDVVAGIFLFILVGLGGYAFRIIPNQMEGVLMSSKLIQHLLVFFLIFFSVDLVNNVDQSPLNSLYNSILIYVFYVLFSKCGGKVAILLVLFLATIFVLQKERNYGIDRRGEDQNYLNQPIDILFYIMFGVLALSTLLTVREQLKTKSPQNIIKYYLNLESET